MNLPSVLRHYDINALTPLAEATIAKRVSTPDQVRGSLSPEHALDPCLELEQREHCQRQKNDDYPQGEVAPMCVHACRRRLCYRAECHDEKGHHEECRRRTAVMEGAGKCAVAIGIRGQQRETDARADAGPP